MFEHADMAAAWDVWSPPPKGRQVIPLKNRAPMMLRGSSSQSGQGGARGTAQTRAQIDRLVRRTQQVVVKVTKRQMGAERVMAHLTYIGRHGNVDLETNAGEIINKRAEMLRLANEWDADNAARNVKRATSISMVLSMPAGTNPDILQNAVRAFASGQFDDNHDYVMALHTDTPRPHVHLSIKIVGYDGQRFSPSPARLQAMREAFAIELRARGIAADATPQLARGVTVKNEPTSVYRARLQAKLKGKRFMLDLQAEYEGLQHRQRRVPLNPFEIETERQLKKISQVYDRLAASLKKSAVPDEVALGAQLVTFSAEIRNAPLSKVRLIAREQALLPSQQKLVQRAPDQTILIEKSSSSPDKKPKPKM